MDKVNPKISFLNRPLHLKPVLWGFKVFVLMVLIVPGALFFNMDGDFSLNVLLIFCIILWSQLRLVYTGVTGERRLTLMCFYSFVYVFLGVQPLLSISVDAFPNEICLPGGLVAFTVFLIFLGISSFEGGYFLGGTGGKRWDDRRLKQLSLRLLWLGGLGAAFLTVAVMAYLGPGTFLALRGYAGPTMFWQREVASYTEQVLILYGVRVYAAVLLFFAVYLWKVRHEIGRYRNFSLKALLYFLCALNLLVSNPLGSPRLWSGSIILTIFFISMRWRGARSFLTLSTGFCLAFLILFAGTDPRRFAYVLLQGDAVGTSTVTRLVQSSVQNLATDANFDAFAMLATTIQYAGDHGYSWGYQVLLPALFWVPRSIWQSKPVGTGDNVARYLQLPNFNVSAPLWAEGYINFGLLGLFCFLFAFGWFARRADEFQVSGYRQPLLAFQSIISSYFAANSFILLRGDLTSGTMYLQLIAVLCFLILLVNDKVMGLHLRRGGSTVGPAQMPSTETKG